MDSDPVLEKVRIWIQFFGPGPDFSLKIKIQNRAVFQYLLTKVKKKRCYPKYGREISRIEIHEFGSGLFSMVWSVLSLPGSMHLLQKCMERIFIPCCRLDYMSRCYSIPAAGWAKWVILLNPYCRLAYMCRCYSIPTLGWTKWVDIT